MAVEKKPTNPVLPNYVPPNTKAYKVKNGDSWVSIAKKLNINPWTLINLNFKTNNPAEVNWYLRHYVGCTLQTQDHNNYCFSASDQPGIIRIPAGPLIKSPGVEKGIRHNVMLIPQRTEKTCWYAALLMIIRYHRRYLELHEGFFYREVSGRPDYLVRSAGSDLDTPEVAKAFEGGPFQTSKMLTFSKVEKFAKIANLKTEHISLTHSEFSRILSAGPFLYGGRVQGYRGITSVTNHAVVVTGISGPESSPMLDINDPWPRDKGARLRYPFADFIKQLVAFKDAAGKTVVVHV